MNTVLVTILAKQWLTEYVWDVGTFVPSPRQRFALRHLRFQLLSRWKVPTIIEYLPLQLVVAVLLFYAGLISFLWILHPIVAAPTTSLIAISVLIFVLTTIAPVCQPLCPFQSVQAWLFYRISYSVSRWFFPEAQSRWKMPSEGDWVDHGIQIIRSQDDASYEAKGLIWVQRSLGTSNPGLIKKVFSCAVSLPGTVAPQVLCVLCADYIPISVLGSEDDERGLQSVNDLGNLLGGPVFTQVFSTIYTYLSTFKDSEAPFRIQDLTDSPEFEPCIWILLGLIRHKWVGPSRAKDGWNLLLELSTSSILAGAPSLQIAIRKRILQTFLDDGLWVWNIRLGFRNETPDIEIKLPESWPLTALTTGAEFEEEHMWTLVMAFTLFVLLRETCNQQALNCCRLITSYLDGKLLSKDHCQNMTRAVQLSTRILSRRARSLNRGAAFHDNFRSLLHTLSAVVIAVPSLEGLKDDVWKLRMALGARTIQDIHEGFNENSKILRDYQMEIKSMTTRSSISDLATERVEELAALMMDAFPSSPWQGIDLDYNYNHVLITAFILNIPGGHLFYRDHFFRQTIFLLDDERLSTIETAFVHTFQATAKDNPFGQNDLSDIPQETILDVLAKECARGKWSVYTEIFNIMTAFLEAEGPIQAEKQLKGWNKSVLSDISEPLLRVQPNGTSRKLESETWKPTQRFLEAVRDNCGYDSWDRECKRLLADIFRKGEVAILNVGKSAQMIPLQKDIDMDGKKAYGWTDGAKHKGDYSQQQKALDANLNACHGENALNYTIWTFCPDDHSHEWGDGWNMEDLSLWSPSDVWEKQRDPDRRRRRTCGESGAFGAVG
ncbi:hypothetical protein H1R20_g10030, partial [Candolleomyces eurysporus]